MSAPNLYFLYNHGTTDSAYDPPFGQEGQPYGDWKVINPITNLVVFTGGGILGLLSTPTCVSGTRDATIRPSVESYVIPQTYVESSTLMYNVPLAGLLKEGTPTPNRYVFGVYVDGIVNSDIWLEAWDDATFSTTTSEVLVGSANSSNNSYVNVVRTTNFVPAWSYPPGWNGDTVRAAYLRGLDERLPLKNSSSVEDEAVYFNIYIRLETDSPTFHNQPVFATRYLYA